MSLWHRLGDWQVDSERAQGNCNKLAQIPLKLIYEMSGAQSRAAPSIAKFKSVSFPSSGLY